MNDTSAGNANGGSAAKPRSAASRAAKIALQVLGFGVGVSLLVWCGKLAFGNPKYAEQIHHFRDAAWWQVGALLALSALTMTDSALVFRATLLPVRRLKVADVIAVNGVCSALSYLPFKMSLLFRVVYHRTRDGISILTIGAWMAAAAAIILVSLGPAVGASLWRKGIDGWWWAITVGGTAGLAVLMVVTCRFLASDRGWAVLEGLARATRMGFVQRAVASDWFEKLHSGVHMLASPSAVGQAMGVRVIDLAAQTLRFSVAAGIVGVQLPFEKAVLAGSSYFFLQATSPAGVGGLREGGVTALLGEDFVVVVLAVTLSEATMNLVMGIAGAAWLRVDRMWWGKREKALGTGE